MSSKHTLTDHFFRFVVDNAAIAGFDGYFREISDSWRETLGWSTETLLSQRIDSFIHPDDRQAVHEARAALHAGEIIEGLRNRYRCIDGSYRWFEWRAAADVERELVFAVARDISEQKHREDLLAQSQRDREELRQQLVLADRMATVGTLAAGMAHEINNPLASMNSNIELLMERMERLAPEVDEREIAVLSEIAGEALESVQRITQIVSGLRTFSGSTSRRLETLELVPLVRRVVDMTVGEIRGRALLIENFELTPPVEADESELSEVVLNLLVNAIQAIPAGDPEGNTIEVRTFWDPAGWAVLQVSDTGEGMSEHVAERVFEPFFTTRKPGRGTGIGLSICHAVATSLGGDLQLESEPGAGTTVRLFLPAVNDTEVGVRSPTGG